LPRKSPRFQSRSPDEDGGSGNNASVNLTQIAPGHSFGAHYHTARDEIDYIIKGQANMTIASQDHLIKAGDMIYIPPGTVHDFAAVDTENFELILRLFAAL
jgi:quercetin dioxygenase-like cupin family protein